MNSEMISDLQALVECESPTDDLLACRKIVDLAAQISKRVTGRDAAVLDISGRPVFWLGNKNPQVVLLAHLDTVWPIGSFQPIWSLTDGLIRGPGCYDMKAGFIQALYAMRDLDHEQVALIATTDEETGSATSRDLIIEVSKKARAVLVLESAIDGKVKVGRKGTSMYNIKVHGRAAHAGLEPEKGVNATIEIARIVNELARLEDLTHGTTVVPTLLSSGTTTNTVPALASLDIDSRSFSIAEMERVRTAIYSMQPEHPEARIEITGGINRPPLEEGATREIFNLARKVASEIGFGELQSAVVGGASDGNFAGIHTQVLDGLGAVGSGAHALSENVQADQLQPRTQLLVALAKALYE